MSLSTLLAEAGLTGRGGAAFSTARKLDLARAHRAALIVNACDGEIGAAKDAWVVEHHLPELIEGARLLTEGVPMFAAHRDSATAKRLSAAGLDVLQVPHRYVSSEESALASLAHGGLARPMTKQIPISAGGQDSAGRPFDPTLVLNAETVWRVAQIARHGAAWFRSFGTEEEPGPRLVSVSIAGQRPVVVQTQAGVSLASLLQQAGIPRDVTAVNIGGLGGGYLTAEEARTVTWSGTSLSAYGLSIGPGVIRVVPAGTCPWTDVASLVRYGAGESARQCGPCMFGLPAIADDVELLVSGQGYQDDLDRLQRRLGVLPGRGACRHPDGVSRFVSSALRCFTTELVRHTRSQCSFVHQTEPEGGRREYANA